MFTYWYDYRSVENTSKDRTNYTLLSKITYSYSVEKEQADSV